MVSIMMFSIIHCTAPEILQNFWYKFFNKEQKNPQGKITRDTFSSSVLTEAAVRSKALVKINAQYVYSMVLLASSLWIW